MSIAAVYDAYTNRDDAALPEALERLQRKLIGDVQALGPFPVAIELGKYGTLATILNKIAAEASAAAAGRVAFLAGFISAYCDYLALIADRHAVEMADAELAADGKGDRIQVTILRTAFAHSGARSKELVATVKRITGLSESAVKFHLKRLAKLKLIEHIELAPKAVAYRISPLGEAVLARRSKRHELALFLVDHAANDGALRSAMQDEITRMWPKEKSEEDDSRAAAPVFPIGETTSVYGAMKQGLNAALLQQYKPREVRA